MHNQLGEKNNRGRVVLNVALLLLLCCALFKAQLLTAGELLEGLPEEISLFDDTPVTPDTPISREMAIDMALEQNRSIEAARNDTFSAQKKLKETKARFGFNAKINANYQRMHDNSSISLPYTYYDVAPVYVPGVTVPPINVPQELENTPMFVITDPYPNVGFFEYGLNKDWQHSADLQIAKPLFTFGKQKSAINAARRNIEIKQLDIKLAELDVVMDAKIYYHNVLLASQAFNAQIESVQRAQDHLEVSDTRYREGVGLKLDTIRAQTDFEKAQEYLIQMEKNYRLAILAFNNIVGLPPAFETKVMTLEAPEIIEIQPLEYYMDLAFTNRPELKQLGLGMDAALLSARVNERKPMVSIGGQWNFHNRGSSLGSQDSWGIALVGEIPIFDNGLAEATVSQAVVEYENLKLKVLDVEEGIRLQVEKAFMDLRETRQRLDTSTSILDMAAEGYRMADISYFENVITHTDLADTEHEFTQARLNFAKALFDYEVAKARLAHDCGVFSLSVSEQETPQ